ncbi:hypothetical protein F5883DRAFT_141174 [Diaporthe sp. PMI_573]|nr:hypothetical protein F5883DRAFT_141174 [Diaporthaceae sp. PMI_573]
MALQTGSLKRGAPSSAKLRQHAQTVWHARGITESEGGGLDQGHSMGCTRWPVLDGCHDHRWTCRVSRVASLVLSSSRRGQAHDSNEKRKRNRQSDVHQQPPRPSARRQDLEEDRGRDHHHSLYSLPRRQTATFAGGSGVKVGVFTLGRAGDFWSSTWVGSVAMLGNIEDGTKTIEMIL